MKKREIKLRAIESNGFDGEVPLKPLSAVRRVINCIININ